MAIPKKYSRKIVVDGESYLWMIRDNDDHYTLSAQLASGEGQKLVIIFSGAGWRKSDGLTELQITPKGVSRLIIGAIKNGWEPSTIGSPQAYNIRNGDKLLGNLKNEGGSKS